jgi:hypothetical protein
MTPTRDILLPRRLIGQRRDKSLVTYGIIRSEDESVIGSQILLMTHSHNNFVYDIR